MPRAGNVIVGKKKKKKYKVDYLRILLIISFILFSATFIKQQLKINEYNVEIKSINEDIEYAKQRIDDLNEVQNMVNDSQYIEHVARTQLGLVKPYEKIFIDIDK